MRKFFDRILGFSRSKSKEEWRAFFGQQGSSLRVFVQQNGEKAALLGFALGILIILFFKLFIVLACVAALLAMLLIICAESKP